MNETVNPTTVDEALELIRSAKADGQRLWFGGSGTVATPPSGVDRVLSTQGLTGVVDYKPDDLTAVVRAGTTLAEVAELFGGHRQSAILPERAPARTIGGVVSMGASGYRRLRYGPTRDRVIGVSLVTGYGELVHGGGQLVKNVTGYDVPRLVTGSHGSLGLIADVSLKLWPLSQRQVTTHVDDPAAERLATYQPVAALQTEVGGSLYIEGSPASVDAVASSIRGETTEGFVWPEPITSDTTVTVSIPARLTVSAVKELVDGGAERYTAQHGVGVVDAGFAAADTATITGLRSWAEGHGGSLVVTQRGSLAEAVPRWGAPPPTVAIQRRMKDLFDPDGICNSGVLPGGL